MAHCDAREGKWRGNWWMEWVASTLHTTSEHGVSSITTADTHTSAAGSRLNCPSRRFKWIRSFRRKTKSGFCACAITFQTQSTVTSVPSHFKRSLPSPVCHHISNAVYLELNFDYGKMSHGRWNWRNKTSPFMSSVLFVSCPFYRHNTLLCRKGQFFVWTEWLDIARE